MWALPPGTTNQVAPIGDKLAVHVASRTCSGAAACTPDGVPFCYDVTLIGEAPASATARARSFDACVGTVATFPGGFVALGGAPVGLRDGRWIDARDPLVAAAARMRSNEGFSRGDELYLGVAGTARLDVLALADGRLRRTIALPFAGRASPVGASPVHGPAIWVASESGNSAIGDVDAAGKGSIYGSGVAPAWAGLETLRPRGGARALWWTGGTALVGMDAKRWTAVFNPLARQRQLVSRRGD